MAKAKSLVIVESPAKAKTIEKYLGKSNYRVVASMGHVRDLPKSKFGIDVENNYEPHYITIRGKGPIIAQLKSEAKKANKVFLASDPDREGEAIAWHLQTALNIDDTTPCRVTFNEITKDAVKAAIKSPRTINMNLVDAQQGRRIMDRIVGYQLSPLLWRKVKKGLSAGRVQSVALRLICERENEIASFTPEEYWSLENILKTAENKTFTTKLAKYKNEKIEIKTKAEMNRVLDDLEGASYIVGPIKKSSRTRKSPLPFTTSTLQQEAYRRLNFTAKKTMRIAQTLYEGINIGSEGSIGLITYMRTDSVRLSDSAISDAADYINQHYGSDYLGSTAKAKANKSNVQDAHEAIRPTFAVKNPESIKEHLSRDEFKLYNLIWTRFIASQMAPAKYDKTSVEVLANDYMFQGNGSVRTFDGFLKVYADKKDENAENLLPALTEKETLSLQENIPKQHFTQPPARYTEASLIKTLEEKGIGRPSTYVATIETIVYRNYITRENKQFYPTEIGILVNDLLVEYFGSIINSEFTAEMETKLDAIEEGSEEWRKVIDDFYQVFEKLLENAEKNIGEIKIQDEESGEYCEKCGKPLLIKMGKFGKFLACSGFPDCRNAKPFLEKIGVKCPKCQKGEIVIRRSKKGRVFYGCSEYPECDFVSWQKPTGEICPQCHEGFLVEKPSKKGVLIACNNTNCNYKREDSDEQED